MAGELPVKPVSLVWLIMALASSSAGAQSGRSGQEAPATPVTGPATTADDDEPIVVEGEVPRERRRVCENRVATGSIMPRRVCRTVAEAEAEREASLEAMERISREREARTLVQEINGVGPP
jgi:hypothetical protein